MEVVRKMRFRKKKNRNESLEFKEINFSVSRTVSLEPYNSVRIEAGCVLSVNGGTPGVAMNVAMRFIKKELRKKFQEVKGIL